MKLALFPLFVLTLAAQVPAPVPPPACLTAPVAAGSVTLTCSMIDNTLVNGDGLGLSFAGGAYIFQVRAVSSDPDVIAVRIGVTFALTVLDGTAQVPVTIWGSVGSSQGTTPGWNNTAAPTPGYRYTFLLPGPSVTGIVVQELKAASSQKF